MKKTLSAALAVLAIASVSCKKADVTGGISFGISGITAEISDQVKSQVGDYTAVPAAADFTITVTNSSKETVWTGLLSSWNPETPLAIGEYSVSALYGDPAAEGCDKPYFCGSATFSIVDASVKEVGIPVSLGNCIVRLQSTEMFDNYFKSYDFTLTTGAGSVLHFNAGQTKAVFIDAYKFTFGGTLVNQGGASKTLASKTYDNLKPGTCYILKLDASNVGGVKITISFNDTVTEVDLGEIELN